MTYDPSTVLSNLRQRAESSLSRLVGRSVPNQPSPEHVQALVHELQVHQIELEMQNQDLRRAHIEAEQSRDRYRELYESIPIGYATIDADGRIYDLNPEGRRLLGVDTTNVLKNFFFFFLSDEADDAILFCRHVMEQSPAMREFKMRTAGDTGFIASLHAVPVAVGGGNVKGLRVAFQNITGRKEAEERLHAQHIELERHRAELRELTEKLFTAQEEERKRIARELHDDHCQRVTALILETNMLTKVCKTRLPDIVPRLAAMSQKLTDILSDFRSLSHELVPRNLGDTSLTDSIRGLIGEFSGKAGFEVNLIERNASMNIPTPIMTVLFRLLQESLSNVAKHAKAKHVTVTLGETGQAVALHVTDDGVGFDPESLTTKEKAIGIVGMRERVRPLGGTVKIISRPSQGTTVAVSVPLHAST